MTDILDIHTHKQEIDSQGKIHHQLSAINGLSIVYAFGKECGSGGEQRAPA